MNREVVVISLLVACSSNVAAQDQKAPPTADPAKVERPVTKVGEAKVWAVLDPISRVASGEFVATILSIEDSKIKTEVKSSRGSTGQSVSDDEGRLFSDTQRGYSPAKQLYNFPLEVGKKWEYSTTFPYTGCGTSRIDMKSEVVG